MKALREIGVKKAAKYAILTLLLVIFKILPSPQLRVIFLRLLGAKIGKNVIIHNVNFINYYRTGFPGLQIGDNCFIGEDTLTSVQ